MPRQARFCWITVIMASAVNYQSQIKWLPQGQWTSQLLYQGQLSSSLYPRQMCPSGKLLGPCNMGQLEGERKDVCSPDIFSLMLMFILRISSQDHLLEW